MPEKKVRAVFHNGRRRSNGEVYSPKHNSRSGGVGDHVLANPDRKNIYITMDFDGNPTLHDEVDFEAHEKQFYEVFRTSLEAQNDRYRKKGNHKNVITMDQYRQRHPPEETIFQVGKMDEVVPPNATQTAVAKWIDQMRATYGTNYKICTVAIHYDEPGTDGRRGKNGQQGSNASGHAHVRAIWVAHGKDGLVASESKALAELNVPYDESRARSRYNNPKVTFTKDARDLFVRLVEEQNVAIETIPARPGKRSMDKVQYITEQLRMEEKTLQEETAKLENECLEMRSERALEVRKKEQLVKEITVLTKEKSRLEAVVERLRSVLLPVKKLLTRLAEIRVFGKDRTALDVLLLDSEIAPAYDALKEMEER